MILLADGNIPKVMPGSAAVRPSYMLQDGQNHCARGTTALISASHTANLSRKWPPGGQQSEQYFQSKCCCRGETYGRHFHNDIVWVLQLGLLNLRDLDGARSGVVDCLHSCCARHGELCLCVLFQSRVYEGAEN